MSETTNNHNFLLKGLVALVVVLLVAVSAQAWYLIDINKRLAYDESQQAHLEKQARVAKVQKPDMLTQVGKAEAVSSAQETVQAGGSDRQDTPAAGPQQKNNHQGKAQKDLVLPQSRLQPRWPRPYRDPFDDPFFRSPYFAQPPLWQPPSGQYGAPRQRQPQARPYGAPYGQPYDLHAQIQAEFERMQEEMDRFFNQSLQQHFQGFNQPGFQPLLNNGFNVPQMDVREDDERYTITVNLPGSDDSSVDVRLEGQQLSIEGREEYQQQDKDAQGNVIFRERRSGAFRRSITLPEAVDEKGMSTDIKNGVLTIVIPKLKDPV